MQFILTNGKIHRSGGLHEAGLLDTIIATFLGTEYSVALF